MAGLCLLWFKNIRPRFLPAFLGITSENAAHRIAVEWEHEDRYRIEMNSDGRQTHLLVELDCALLMRGTEHEWHGRGKPWGCNQLTPTTTP
jgi:hypothetical protein